MDWTIGLFFGHFLDHFFLESFSGPTFGLVFGPFALREGWNAVYQYSGRGGRQTFVTGGEGGRRTSSTQGRWEMVVSVNVTD